MLDNGSGLLLRVRGLVAGYGPKQVLNGINLEVGAGDFVAVLGHNGAGKSTLLRAMFGLIVPKAGEILIDDHKTTGLSPSEMIGLGVAFVPQGGRVFTELTVRENFNIAGARLGGAQLSKRLKHVLEIFPLLGSFMQRRAELLSGGERQMVAMASGLIPSPRLLLLDEPSLGLAPSLASGMLRRIRQIADEGVGVIVVEQRVREALKYAHRAYVLRNGSVTYSGATASLQDDDSLREFYL